MNHSSPSRADDIPAVLKQFDEVWTRLFQSPVHLDSVLSKQSIEHKTLLARIIPAILMRPASMAEALGIGIPPNEPWNLSSEQLVNWRPARLMAERLYEMIRASSTSPGADMPECEPCAGDFPPLMVEDWTKNWGKEGAERLVRSLGANAPLSIRVRRDADVQALALEMRKWAKMNQQSKEFGHRMRVEVEKSSLVPFGIRLSGYAPILRTEWYEKGLFEIQDEGSQWMALFTLWPDLFKRGLQAEPGKTGPSPGIDLTRVDLPKLNPQGLDVVDACAGAGGKTLALADLLFGKGRIYSYDTSDKKLKGLKRRAVRAGFNNIQTVTVENENESSAIGRFQATANIVLVDAPCSGWGVLRRNPDIKWRQSSDVLKRMPDLQLRLLNEYSRLVKEGGRLVYGVCTFRGAETQGVVENFLKAHPDFVSEGGGFLGPGSSDGFFMNCFRRKDRTETRF